MAKVELGTKRVCTACSTRFYDLGKSPAVCPKCGTEQPIEQLRPRRGGGGNVAEEKRPKKPAPVPGAAEDADMEVEGVEDSDDEDVLEDASDLEDDNDTIGPEIEVGTEGDDNER
ncbi:MAG: TIGR02300 family protein [Acetobacteraceae bacterium]|nr:TIGR02300 family protein [Acetobacteraceae bacterium]